MAVAVGAALLGACGGGAGKKKAATPPQAAVGQSVSEMQCDFGKGYTIVPIGNGVTQGDIDRVLADVPAGIRDDMNIVLQAIRQTQAARSVGELHPVDAAPVLAAQRRIAAFVGQHCPGGAKSTSGTPSSSTTSSTARPTSTTARAGTPTTLGPRATTSTTAVPRTTTSSSSTTSTTVRR